MMLLVMQDVVLRHPLFSKPSRKWLQLREAEAAILAAG